MAVAQRGMLLVHTPLTNVTVVGATGTAVPTALGKTSTIHRKRTP